MKFALPLSSRTRVNSSVIGLVSKSPSSFAEKNAEDVSARYNRALEERKKMVRAQYAADKPLDETYKLKGNLLDRKINRFKSGFEDTK